MPTCYRHPDKETWVRCQRCERPICPDCMRDASVGFQCPECVADGNKGIRQARSAFGGNLVRTPIVTYTILVVTLLVYGAQYLLGNEVTSTLAMQPFSVAAFGEYYRLFTVALVHGGIFHILFNCWALWVVGPYLERSFGHVRYLALYVISAIGGSVLSLWADSPGAASVGASGAIFGLFGATFVVGRRLNLDVRYVAGLIAINLVLTFVLSNISWTGHVGGLVTGSLLAGALAYAPSNNRTLWQVLAIVGAVVVLAVLVMIRASAIVAMLS
ncbi:rhomboid family intramembrane serine protease [Nonomuraea phyllanthi]|uniref:Rhomboid family intramembrane serine protease n=1 Tax=Nonomuraea phyllanthi TaxID=2219224 RepID=A0A5C4WT46_9ACTN|nr:rhomboid family intramembrane serine protease [Nonomuraea phyllanthi]QFY13893.1 rhomboid family intramembrane serine protease [Nonomuraea phyllanthi]